MKNQPKKTTMLLAIVAAIIVLFSAGCRDYDNYELIEKDVTISGFIKGIIIDGPWEVSVTQDSENNSATIQYNVPSHKIKAELRPNGYLHLKLYNLTNYRNVKLKANIRAAALENIEGSGAAGIYTYGIFLTSSDITLSGASTIDGFLGMGDYIKMNLSGSSKLKKCQFRGKRIDATLSGASDATFAQAEVNRCTVNGSGASTFRASGFAEETNFTGSGASYFYTFELESENLDIELSGASNGEVTVNHKIKGNLSGASILRYKKAEDIKNVTITGGSKIIKVD